MAQEFINGQMAENMKVIILMIKNMDMEFIHTLTVDLTRVNGRMVNSTVKVYL